MILYVLQLAFGKSLKVNDLFALRNRLKLAGCLRQEVILLNCLRQVPEPCFLVTGFAIGHLLAI